MRSTTRLAALAATLLGLGAGALTPTVAGAADAYPCGKATQVWWSSDSYQECPLSALQPNGAPLYRTPVAIPAGAAQPRPDGWVPAGSATTAHFACQRDFPSAVVYHQRGWRNRWWAYTRSVEGVFGWVPEVYFRGGANDEADTALRTCPRTSPAPPAPPAPMPTPTPKPSPTPTPPGPPQPDPPAPPSTCDPLPAATDLKLSALVGRKRQVVTRFGRRATTTGTLTDAAGAPLGNAQICVLARTDTRGSAAQQLTTIATDDAGVFSFPLDPGPSRILRFVYRAGDRAASASVAVRVRAPLSLHASRRRIQPSGVVAFGGRLAKGARWRGVLVELQAMRGRRYQTFATTRTRRDGSFRYRYRFSAGSGGTYALRARVPRQAGLPFATGATRTVHVRVG